ncbi:MAG TPA: hypothetical protein ENO30_05270 [Thermodesulfobium narugense]|nr:hypothetical protein [Thermodesulfobium narugense]
MNYQYLLWYNDAMRINNVNVIVNSKTQVLYSIAVTVDIPAVIHIYSGENLTIKPQSYIKLIIPIFIRNASTEYKIMEIPYIANGYLNKQIEDVTLYLEEKRDEIEITIYNYSDHPICLDQNQNILSISVEHPLMI